MKQLLLLVLPVALWAGDFRVASYKLLTANGGRVSWSKVLNLIAFDQAGTSGFYDIYTMKPDGTSAVCLTCSRRTALTGHVGNPDWHPSGQFLAIQMQWTSPGIAFLDKLASPGDGNSNDLWLMNAAGTQYWQVTTKAPGILHPHFSHDGTKLMWSQRSSGNNWAIMLADITVSTSGVPSFANIRAIPPCASGTFCESHGFSRDDSTMFFAGTIGGQSESGLDIYSYQIATGVLTNLTNSPSNWDEHARPMPNADKLVWMSGTLNGTTLHTDYWMMDLDGSNKNKLTWFNDSRSTTSMPFPSGVSVSDSDWSPDGTQFVAYFIPEGNGIGNSGSIYLITLESSSTSVSAASYARGSIAPESIAGTFGTALSGNTVNATTAALPTDLDGTTVVVTDAKGATHNATMFFVSPLQVNWFVPAETAPGPATVAITNESGAQLRGTVDIEPVSPGLFAATASGSGVLAGYVQVIPAGSQTPNAPQNAFSCPAGPTSCQAAGVSLGGASDTAFLVLFGTGIRQRSVVTAQIGSLAALPVAYAGAQGAFTGLDQVNVQLPRSLAGAGLVNVALTVDGLVTNTVQLRIQ